MQQSHRRIHITGNAGSGKSTLARQIGRLLDVPVYGLDAIVWQSGWRKTPRDQRARMETDLIANPEWIIEGVSTTVRRAADVIIFLDTSRPRCYLNCLKRNWRYLFSNRPGLPENCPEIAIILPLTKLIWHFPKNAGLDILQEIARQGRKRTYIVRTKADHENLLQELAAYPASGASSNNTQPSFGM